MWVWVFACGTGASIVASEGPALTVSPAVLDFEAVAVGSAATRTFTVTNAGEPAMGVRVLPSADPAFVATIRYDLASDAAGVPFVLDPGDPVLPPGVSLPVEVVFTPTIAGPTVASLGLETFGDGAASFPDPRRPIATVLATATTPIDAIVTAWPRFSRVEDLGWISASTVARPTFENAGPVPYALTTAEIAGCDRAFALVGGLPATVPPGGAADVEVRVTPSDTAPLRCDLEVTTDLGADFPTLTSTLLVNTPTCSSDAAPEIVLISPTAALSVSRTAAATITFRVSDADQPESTLDCSVTSYLKGKTIGGCGLTGPGPVDVEIPVPSIYASPTIDVWTVTATDACGHVQRATFPVMISTAWPNDDEDGDVYGTKSTPPDCDETDATIYPYAAELVDGLDNDCDGVIDEDTVATDDDFDGVSERDGDCDDGDGDVCLGALEQANEQDDDCDGLVDEGTLFGDDDGDGFAERDGDCDDTTAQRRPGAGELCGDGVDDDCDGEVDEAADCRERSMPAQVSAMALSATVVGPGQTIDATIRAVGAPVALAWSASRGALSSGVGEAVTWTAPDGPGSASILVTVRTGSGEEHVVEGVVEVLAAAPTVDVVEESLSGCDTGGRFAAIGALAGLLLRRRR